MRRRLRQLPDATIRAVGRLDRNAATGEIPVVAVELRKEGDQLTLDYSGFLRAGARRDQLHVGRPDGRPVGGPAAHRRLRHPVERGPVQARQVVCPEGRICNARQPAAVSANISGAVWEVEIAT